ncbi:MAG: hypothetical protein AAGI25_05180 [Bacteroidota bacterium]
MFVRRKPNKSGVVSIQVIDKSKGYYQVVKTIGSSSNIDEINRLEIKAHQWLADYKGTLFLVLGL